MDDRTPDLFGTERVGQGSSDQVSADVTVAHTSSSRSIVPRDLRTAITYLDEHEFKRLVVAVAEEAGRRGIPARFDREQAAAIALLLIMMCYLK
jgi:hypothetical protein